MSEIKHAVDCSCVICKPDDEWTYTREVIPPHPLCCSECKELRAALPALVKAAQKVRNTVEGLDDADHVHANCPRCRRALSKRVAALDAALAPFEIPSESS